MLEKRFCQLSALVDLLHDHLDSIWINPSELFNKDTLPDAITIIGFSKGVWYYLDHQYQGTEVYYASAVNDRYRLLRHKFGNKWCLWGCFKRRAVSIECLVRDAMSHLPGQCAVAKIQLEKVTAPLIVVLDKGLTEVVRLQRPPLVVTPGTSAQKKRSDATVQDLHKWNDPVAQLLALSSPLRQNAILKLVDRSKELEIVLHQISDQKSAVGVLSMFKDDLTRTSFVDRLLKSDDVKSSLEIFPRKAVFGQLSSSNQDNAVTFISEIAIKIAQLLLPKDAEKGASALLRRMTVNTKFRCFVLPASDETKPNSYDEWTANPVVAAIKSALTKLGFCDQQLREQLLSPLSDYPKDWLKRHFGVGRMVVNKAIDHANAYGPGLRLTVAIKLSRDRRTGPKEEFLLTWMERRENIESSPEIRRYHSGRLVQEATTYRVNNRYQGYSKYCSDALAEDYPCYSRAHFYLRNKEMGLVDSKSEAGLCPNCYRYGIEARARVEVCVKLIYTVTDPKRKQSLDQINTFRNYFTRGGLFYQSLATINACSDWCCRLALSDPFDEDLQSACDDHEHSHRDQTLLTSDDFFRRIILYGQVLVGEKEFPVQMNSGGSARAQHLRDGLFRVEGPVDAPAVDIPWNQSSMSHHDLNMLSLCDCIRKCYDDHLRYRRHLYLDRNQSYGEIELNRTSRFIAKLDYMMKLRAKQYNADTSIFHLMMSKGCSVHVFCLKGRIDDERLKEMRSKMRVLRWYRLATTL